MWPSVANENPAAPSAHGTLYVPLEDEIAPMFHGTSGLGRVRASIVAAAIHGTTEQQRLVMIVRLFVQNPLYWVVAVWGSRDSSAQTV
jgi:hypothetical protein